MPVSHGPINLLAKQNAYKNIKNGEKFEKPQKLSLFPFNLWYLVFCYTFDSKMFMSSGAYRHLRKSEFALAKAIFLWPDEL